MADEALGAWLAPWTLLLTLAVAAVFLYWRSKYPPFRWGETAGPVPKSLLVPVLSVGGLILATGAVQMARPEGIVSWWGAWLGLLLTGLGVLSVTVFRRVERYYAAHTRSLILGLTIASALATLLWWVWWHWWLPWLLLVLLIAYLIWIGSVVLVCGCGGGGGGTPTGPAKCTVSIGVTMTPVDGGPSLGQHYTRSFTFTAASSLGHPLGVVAVTSVETSVGGLSWSAMAAGGQTTTPGNPADMTPATAVDTTVAYTETNQRWARITTSYTCPTCGATTSDVTEERIN